MNTQTRSEKMLTESAENMRGIGKLMRSYGIVDEVNEQLAPSQSLIAVMVRTAVKNNVSHMKIVRTLQDMFRDNPNYSEIDENLKNEIINF